MNGRKPKDYYKILGVSKEASQKEIEKAFRELAKKHHPAANPGNKEAEEKFKEITEAYNVLSKPQKRKEYDQGTAFFGSGSSGFEDFGFGSFSDFDFGGGFSDLFDMFTGGAGRAKRAYRERGRDLITQVRLTFEDALKGVSTRIIASREVVCSDCKGSGARPGTAPVMCSQCQGKGVTAINQGFFSLSRTCSGCGGRGTVVQDSCPKCQGSGRAEETKKVTVRIPAGVENGSRIKVRGEGEAGVGGGPTGDLYVVAQVAPHRFFKRQAETILLDLPVTFAETALGAKVKVPTVDGKAVTLKVPAGTQDGQTLRVRNKGFPRLDGFGRGDMLVTVKITVPARLSKEEEALLSKYASLSKEDPRGHLK